MRKVRRHYLLKKVGIPRLARLKLILMRVEGMLGVDGIMLPE